MPGDRRHFFRSSLHIDLNINHINMTRLANISKEEKTIISAARQRPSVSIVMTFEAVIASKDEMRHRLQITLDRVKRELLAAYPESKAMPVVLKLQNLVRNVDYSTDKRAIALFVSPQTENIFYLDTPVEDRLVIDNTFSIRDLVYSRKKHIEYLFLLLSESSSKMFLGNTFKMIPVKFNVPDVAAAYKNDVPERVANFSDPDQLNEKMLDKFLHHIDQGLTIALKNYPFPVFIAGADRVLGHFKRITRNERSLAEFINGNYIDSTEAEILALMEPHLINWAGIKQKNLLSELQMTNNHGKLIYGINEVLSSVNEKNCRLLVVEKNYYSKPNSHITTSFYVKDAVDQVIEKVLQYGGDVEFVDDESLKSYKHIALIPFY